ncbi:MAG: threonine--tRNA ligase [Brachymonas sp.]|jgi:threonyl-tRNA synthetase|nr:threonine--tRNA ligase [Brachymonas sp.]MBP6138973.1 threonine--tRNA ligase [Brachymonas sp.]MBP6966524.1 threonine--tRNA ligase [Brachymonas sp.]MBP7246357.1 threonine--tRNA ligase [Brachymonas sp.]MBP7740203.1 threonine--tRNA ligase [Brachymonas sp.]
MIQITLPDGSQRNFEQSSVTVAEVAASIGSGLAKAAIGGKVDGKLVDTSYPISQNATLAIITAKDADGLEMIRHSTAHLLAYAVKELFPDAQVTIGPVVENGFYYDFSYKRPFTPEDLAAIEKKMTELASKDEPVLRRVLPRDEAVDYFKDMGEAYKAEIIASIPTNEDVSLYREGTFEDLCRGPHVPSTGKLKHFKLMKVAGAYWRGDHRNEMLQRIYGTAWASKEELQQYLHMLEEAEKRDHRKLGKELDLFHIDEHSPGTIFWHPKGWTLWQEVEQYMRRVYRENGYQEVKGPQILDKGLWEKTGHWDKYRENMFTTESEKREYALKPMNCPGHILIFKQGVRSYRDLPLRYGEFGACHRNEPTGGLHGIMRVRAFTQDDGHIFCTEAQIQSEVQAFTSLLQKVYADFGFNNIIYKLSTRPEQRIGTEESWDKAENALAEGLRASGCEFTILPGEGAFYGPKIEYTLKDALGREWQCGTIQVDPNLPERLDAEFVGEDGHRHRPLMLHRAIVGSLERFIGILIEQYAGALPAWLAPEQVVVLNITDAQAEYAQNVAQTLQNQGFRAITDLNNDKITYKIRSHATRKLPYILVVGDKEKENGTVAVRARGNQDLGVMPVEAFMQLLRDDVARKSSANTAAAA